MAKITYELDGRQAVQIVPDELVDYYHAKHGVTVVVDEDAAAELKGPELDEAARELAGITDPGHTPAEKKRAAVVAATAPQTEEK